MISGLAGYVLPSYDEERTYFLNSLAAKACG
jgi:hypothetical protein